MRGGCTQAKKDPKNPSPLWIIWINDKFFFSDFSKETKRPILIKKPDLGFSIERHPYRGLGAREKIKGLHGRPRLPSSGHRKEVFGNLFFLSIQFTLFISSFNVLSCYFNVLLNLVASLTVWIQLISWRSSFRKRKTNSTRLRATQRQFSGKYLFGRRFEN